MYELTTELNKLCQKLDDKWGINSGGCCYIVYLLAQFFEEIHEPYLIKLFNRKADYTEEEALYNIVNKSNGFPCMYEVASHYWIYLPKYNIEVNEGGFSEQDGYQLNVPITPEQLLWIYNNGDWNTYYNPKHNNSVKKILTNVFKKYEKEL